jgi:hypothetical protein
LARRLQLPNAIDVANGLYYLTQKLGKAHAKIGIIYQNDDCGAAGHICMFFRRA